MAPDKLMPGSGDSLERYPSLLRKNFHLVPHRIGSVGDGGLLQHNTGGTNSYIGGTNGVTGGTTGVK